MNQNLEMIVKAVMIGHAIGDALGVPVEFCERDELSKGPVDDMEGFGTFPVPAGSWSDDTSMSIATLDSLKLGTLNFDDIMINFGKWYYKDEFTPTGEMFDVGNTCSYAIDNYFVHKKPINSCGLDNEHSNGNGSLMRIHPIALYLHTRDDLNIEEKIAIIHSTSAITHAHIRSQIACGIYSFILNETLEHPEKQSIQIGINKAFDIYKNEPEIGHYKRLFDSDFVGTPICNIKSSGYVVDTLEAALWCVLTTDSYSDCVLKAVNLGDDTDTVAAIAGGIAGALYGYNAIPNSWKDTLLRRDYIEQMCEVAAKNWTSRNFI